MDNLAGLHPSLFVIIMALVAAAPFVLGLMTSYLKISIVFGMVKNGLGTQSSPSALTVLALSAALTCFIMSPVVEESAARLNQFDVGEFSKSPSLKKLAELKGAFEPWEAFLTKHAGAREVATLQRVASAHGSKVAVGDTSAPQEPAMMQVLLPAFVLTELKEGFAMGFVLLLPFLVIDLIVSNLLVGLGMTMVSPVMIALPLKLLLFVVSDGWLLLAQGLVNSYR